MIGQAISAVANLATGIASQVSSAKNNKKADALIATQRSENEQWYNNKMAEDYTQRSDVQAVLNKQREMLDERYRQSKAANIVSGGTAESLALEKEAANKAMSDTMTNIASQASAYKDSIEQQYRQQDAASNQQMVDRYRQTANQQAQAASQAFSAAANSFGSGIGSALKKQS